MGDGTDALTGILPTVLVLGIMNKTGMFDKNKQPNKVIARHKERARKHLRF